RAALRAAAGRPHHPRGRHDADGQRLQDVGAERELPGPRRAQSVRRRRRAVRLERPQELHVDDTRAGDAHGRAHRAAAQSRNVMKDGHRGLRTADCGLRPITRRSALAIITGAPMAAALVWTPAEAEQAHTHAEAARADAATKAAPFKPKFFTAHE